MRKVKFFFWLFLGVGLAAPACAQEIKNNNCIVCHADQWEQMKGSIHSQHQITCDRCHGGDPAKEDAQEAKAPGTNFVAVPDKKQIAERCGQCHADVEAMNFYGLPTDQLARYKTSAHGKLLFEHGDEHGAVCTDCHGYHDVVAVTDPQSPVYPLNLPATCNRCHGDKAVMTPYKHPVDIFEKYKKSVHGVALFEKKDLSVATCVKCHGSHGAMPPGVKEIGNTCGKCHVNEKKYFLQGPHAQASQDGYFSECASCHDYHDIQRPDTNLYNTACLNCHSEGDEAFKRGQKIKEMIDSSHNALAAAEQAVKQAAMEGIFVDEEAASLQEVKTNVIEMAPLQHSLSVAKIAELHDSAVSLTDGIKKGIQGKRRSLQWRKIALVPLWIFVFLMVVVLQIKYNELKGKKMSETRAPDAAGGPSPCCPAREKRITRRDFIDLFIKGGLLVTLAGMILPALNYIWPVTRRGPAGGLQEVAKLEDIPVWGAKKVTLGASALIVLRTPNEVKAFSAVCTHLGCLVDWDNQKRLIECPCHAGIFDMNGRVVSGPPPKPLPEYTVKVIDGKIFVAG